MDLNQIQVFHAIVKHAGISHAAVALGLPKSTVSRKLTELEKRLGVTLLQRTTRKQVLTKAGESYFLACSKALEELDLAEQEATLEQSSPKGVIKFTAPAEIGSHLLPRVLKKFREKYPDIYLDLHFIDRVVQLREEGFDLALRGGTVRDLSLKTRRLGKGGFQLYASPSYVSSAPAIKRPEDLLRHSCIVFFQNPEQVIWKLSDEKSRYELKIQNCLRVDTLSACARLAEEGAGITMLPSFLAAPLLKAKKLVPILHHLVGERGHFSLVYPEQRFLPPKTRVFIDFLVEHFPNDL